jgi:DNA polymerase (family 10)
MTERLCKAAANPQVNLIAHPTGRILGGRSAYQINFTKLFETCAANNTALEINASPTRLDLNAEKARQARKAGVKIAINTDAHHYREYDDIKLGIATARRGWLEKADVINTFSHQELLAFLQVD